MAKLSVTSSTSWLLVPWSKKCQLVQNNSSSACFKLVTNAWCIEIDNLASNEKKSYICVWTNSWKLSWGVRWTFGWNLLSHKNQYSKTLRSGLTKHQAKSQRAMETMSLRHDLKSLRLPVTTLHKGSGISQPWLTTAVPPLNPSCFLGCKSWEQLSRGGWSCQIARRYVGRRKNFSNPLLSGGSLLSESRRTSVYGRE